MNDKGRNAVMRSGLQLLAAMLLLPLIAAAGDTIGTLQSSGVIYVGNAVLKNGSAVSSGDRIQTAASSATLALPLGDLIRMDPDSTTTVTRLRDGLHISLQRGRFTLCSASADRIHVDAGGITLAPLGAESSLATVALNGDGSLTMSVRTGTVSVANLSGGPLSVHAGEFIKVNPIVEQNERAGTAAHGKLSFGQKLRTFQIGTLSHASSVAIVAGSIGGIITGIALAVR